jgi:hypothetical protein
MIEQFARGVGKVIRLRERGDLECARVELAELTQGFLGIDSKLLLSLSEAQIISLFTVGGRLDSGRAMVTHDILLEEAAMETSQGDEVPGRTYRLRALSLLLEVISKDPLFRTPEYLAAASHLMEALGEDLPAAVRVRLLGYYEARGEYAEAEDLLFHLVENGFTELVAEGVAFYGRLLELPDADLEAGGLPRNEVEEGLSQLQKLVE